MAIESREPTGSEHRVVSIDAASDVYPDQWILMQVTERSEFGAPRAGIVLAAGSNEHVHSVLMEDVQSGRPRGPYERLFAFKHQVLEPEESDDLMTEAMLLEHEG